MKCSGYGLRCWRGSRAVVEFRHLYRNIGGEGPFVAVSGLCFRCFSERRQASVYRWGDAGDREDWTWLTTLVNGEVPT